MVVQGKNNDNLFTKNHCAAFLADVIFIFSCFRMERLDRDIADAADDTDAAPPTKIQRLVAVLPPVTQSSDVLTDNSERIEKSSQDSTVSSQDSSSGATSSCTIAFECVFCRSQFLDFRALQCHLIEREPLVSVYTCHLCYFGFQSVTALHNHDCLFKREWQEEMKVKPTPNPMKVCYHFMACYGCGEQSPLFNCSSAQENYRQLVKCAEGNNHPTTKLTSIAVFASRQLDVNGSQKAIKIEYIPWIRSLPLKCVNCLYEYAKIEDIESHAFMHDKSENLKCPNCLNRYSAEVFFREHLLSEHFTDDGNIVAFLETSCSSLKEAKGKKKAVKKAPVYCRFCDEQYLIEGSVASHVCVDGELRVIDGDKSVIVDSVTDALKPLQVNLSVDRLCESTKSTFQAVAKLFFTKRLPINDAQIKPIRSTQNILGCSLCYVLFSNVAWLEEHVQLIHRDEAPVGVRFASVGKLLTRRVGPNTYGVICPDSNCKDLHCSIISLRRHLLVSHMKWVPVPRNYRSKVLLQKADNLTFETNSAFKQTSAPARKILVKSSQPKSGTAFKQVSAPLRKILPKSAQQMSSATQLVPDSSFSAGVKTTVAPPLVRVENPTEDNSSALIPKHLLHNRRPGLALQKCRKSITAPTNFSPSDHPMAVTSLAEEIERPSSKESVSEPPSLEVSGQPGQARPPSCSELHPLPGGLVPEIDALVPKPQNQVVVQTSVKLVGDDVRFDQGAAIAGKWRCPVCENQSFDFLQSLRSHLKDVHTLICFKCAACFVSQVI